MHTAETALERMKREEAHELLFTLVDRTSVSRTVPIKLRGEMDAHINRYKPHDDTMLSLRWSYLRGEDSLTLEFYRGTLSPVGAGQTISEGLAMYTYQRAQHKDVRMTGIYIPDGRLRTPDAIVNKYQEELPLLRTARVA